VAVEEKLNPVECQCTFSDLDSSSALLGEESDFSRHPDIIFNIATFDFMPSPRFKMGLKGHRFGSVEEI
jgi:hypothetical protein